ncbi:hypothetical protein [Nocardia transvalensis]|uniref:hypothetical protein n=1 Tax=Nocardia transvalensis TaxID=37333 RepID=UPI00189439A3|nr:hypothetical protein [Nocardia transvalensis]MBF6329176.1 hypothetical protein [Nocardia transvalensis]
MTTPPKVIGTATGNAETWLSHPLEANPGGSPEQTTFYFIGHAIGCAPPDNPNIGMARTDGHSGQIRWFTFTGTGITTGCGPDFTFSEGTGVASFNVGINGTVANPAGSFTATQHGNFQLGRSSSGQIQFAVQFTGSGPLQGVGLIAEPPPRLRGDCVVAESTGTIFNLGVLEFTSPPITLPPPV